MDTIVHGMSQLLENRSAILALLIIFIFVTLFNFLVVSGSGKAVIVMPILQPLGKILNINQQVLVLTYQYGDGITNSFWPGSSLVQLSNVRRGLRLMDQILLGRYTLDLSSARSYLS